MDFGGLELPEWLAKQPVSQFPSGFAYASQYDALATHLNSRVHNKVNETNIHIDHGYLTDHGPDHIRKLVARIQALLSAAHASITPYEAYLLLAAAQFHDSGNIFGRKKHEEKAAQVMRDVGTLLPTDAVEKKCIFQIAQAHGGEEKDRLSHLNERENIRGHKVRTQLLAAILKFADELAEDSERAAGYPLSKGLLPAAAEIYHAYALALNSVVVDAEAREVQMRFHVSRSDTQRKYVKASKDGQPDGETYLIDEIFERVMKTHCERVYCSRFMRSVVDLIGISVHIEVVNETTHEELEKIAFRLRESGYPDLGIQHIYALCPDLNKWNGNGPLNGAALAAKFGGTS